MDSNKAIMKMGKYNLKATKFDRKANKLNAKISSEINKSNLYYKSAEKFVSEMTKAFANVPIDNLPKQDVSNVNAIVEKIK